AERHGRRRKVAPETGKTRISCKRQRQGRTMNNLMSLLFPLHLLAAVVWVGGMFFAYMALRPAAATVLPPPQRLPLWTQTFRRFFPWVWITVVLLPVT